MPRFAHPIVMTLNHHFVADLTPSKLVYYVRVLYDVCQASSHLTHDETVHMLQQRLRNGGIAVPDIAYERTAELLRSTSVDVLTIRTDHGRVLYQGLAAPVDAHSTKPTRAHHQDARPLPL